MQSSLVRRNPRSALRTILVVLSWMLLLSAGPLRAQETIFTSAPDWFSYLIGETRSITVCDIDADGDLDLVCGNAAEPDRAYLNRDGILDTQPSWQSNLSRYTWTVAAGDITGNGYPDLVCGSWDAGIAIYLNNGGMFDAAPALQFGSEYEVRSVALGDIDNDGDLDLVCGNADQQNHLFLNENGMLRTQPAWSSEPSNATWSIILGDINSDGYLDLVCGNYGQSNTLYLNDHGAFPSSPSWLSAALDSPFSLELGDVNGDGRLDLVCGSWDQNTLYLNQDGLFASEPAWSPPAFDLTTAIALGDVDADGDLDLVCGNLRNGPAYYLNREGVLDTLQTWSAGIGFETRSIALADMSGDGMIDLVCGNSAQGNTLYINRQGSFRTAPVAVADPAYNTLSVSLGDVDGDGDLDMVCGNDYFDMINYPNALYLNDGGVIGSEPAWLSGVDDYTFDTVMGDVDGDGDLDLICGNQGWPGENNTLFRNESGIFETAPFWSSNPAFDTRSVALGDIDNDGDLDLVCGNAGFDGQPNTLYLNTGTTLDTLPAWSSAPENQTWSVALGDMDGDGDLDLVCGNYQQENTLYINDNGMFQNNPAWISSTSEETNDIALGDIDGNGALDLICGNYVQANTMYLNMGGVLQSEPAWSSGLAGFTREIALADIDGDGDLDLVCGNEGENTVYSNRNGMLDPMPSWISELADNTGGIALGDMDLDGDIDLVCGNYGQNYLYHGIKEPAFLFDPVAPANHLLNNSPRLNHGSIEWISDNIRAITFSITDVEWDRVWILPEYQFMGNPEWHPVLANGSLEKIGPVETSPLGTNQLIMWDITNIPFDRREVVLRLKAIEIPGRVSRSYHTPSYLMNVGEILPLRPELVVMPEELLFPSATLGDTVSGVLAIANAGTAPLTVNADATDPQVYIPGPMPVTIPPGGSVSLTVRMELMAALADPGDIRITSNDPTNFNRMVPLAVDVLPLDFASVFIYTDGFVEQGEDVTVSIVLQDSVHSDSAKVFCRPGGATGFASLPLERIDDPVNDQYFISIPADSVSDRGLDYYIEVYNGRASNTGTLQRLRTRVHNLSFPFGLDARTYRMMSLPLAMEGTIAGSLSDDLGGRDNTEWRLFSYDPGDSAYAELPNDTEFSFTQGRAYWLVSKEPKLCDTGPTAGLSAPADSAFTITLEPGWNMVGNPFNFAVAWDSCRVNGLTMADAEGTSVSRPVCWVPGEGYCFDMTVLQPFGGYWIRNLDTDPMILSIPPHEAAGSTFPSIVRESKDNEKQWGITIAATSKGVSDMHNRIGIMRGAEDAYDRYDRFEPPANPGAALSLCFPHDSWNERAGCYAYDIRGTEAAPEMCPALSVLGEEEYFGQAWRFDVSKNYSVDTAGDIVYLTFDGVSAVPDEFDVLLVDRDLERIIDLRLHDHYRYFCAVRDAVVSEEHARFMLIVGSKEYIEGNGDIASNVPRQTTLHQNYPNPFNPATIITYEIAKRSRVDVRVYDITGALIKVLERREREPGIYEIGWNGENEDGCQVSSGIYFYRLVAGDVTETRKMHLIK